MWVLRAQSDLLEQPGCVLAVECQEYFVQRCIRKRVIFMDYLREQTEDITRAERIGMVILMEHTLPFQDEDQIVIGRSPRSDMIIRFRDIMAQPDRPGSSAFLIGGWCEQAQLQKFLIILA
ncbi:hypothetical protein D3C73_1036240 [compost metagenome]